MKNGPCFLAGALLFNYFPILGFPFPFPAAVAPKPHIGILPDYFLEVNHKFFRELLFGE
jgi:hypothetical protein